MRGSVGDELAELVVADMEAGRLDRVMSRVVPDLSRSAARRLIAAGSVFVNGRRCRVLGRSVRAGDQIRIATRTPRKAEVSSLTVLHEDGALVAVDKPSGMPSAPTRASAADTAFEVLRQQLVRATRAPVHLSLVHRLDAPTSGVLLFARGRRAVAELSRAFRERRVEKEYTALVAGSPENNEGCVELPVRRTRGRSVAAPGGKPAVTRWQVLRRGPRATLVRLLPSTGRTHQLRIHMSAIGHPIVGDRTYGGPAAPRLMLHATALRFPHPTSDQQVEVSSPLPPEFA